jgi:hypothetical protein
MLATIQSSRLLSKHIKITIYKTIILPVVLYGCETLSLSLREGHRLRVLRRVFGPKRDEVKGGYSSQIRMIRSRRMQWAGHVARMGEMRTAYRILVGKPEGKRPLGRPRHRWVDNIKIYLTEIGGNGLDWIDMALVNTVLNFWIT